MGIKTVAAILVGGVALAAGYLLRGDAGVISWPAAEWFASDASPGARTLGLAPITLGNPTAAATLQTRAPERHQETDDSPRTGTVAHKVTVGRGDTLASVLIDVGVPSEAARQAIAAARSAFDPRSLRAGQALQVVFRHEGPVRPPAFDGFSLMRDFQSRLVVERNEAGGYASRVEEIPITQGYAVRSGSIRSSLYEDGLRAGVSPAVLAELIRIFSWDVDFQRDIRDGDGFEVFYERMIAEGSEVVREGPILMAALVLRGVRFELTRHTDSEGTTDYFDPAGASVQKALLRTPIDGARLSSRFGVRHHPILGYSLMHRGVDFAAPTGTPIYAAGDGNVDFAGWHGAYGRYVRLRHHSGFSTAYAHMDRIAVRGGQRVRQGQVIGYVGTTGRSTGAHLHYEILRQGQQVDPIAVKMPSGRKLAGRELSRFERQRAEIAAQIRNVSVNPRFAQRRL